MIKQADRKHFLKITVDVVHNSLYITGGNEVSGDRVETAATTDPRRPLPNRTHDIKIIVYDALSITSNKLGAGNNVDQREKN